jgi:single-strand DNA-binding protein
MATTITGKLNKAAREFQAGAYTGFGVNVGKQYYDTDTKSKQWCNYEAAFFVNNDNNQAKMDFMRLVLIEGAVIEIAAKSEKPKLFEGTNGPVLSIQLLECDLGYVFNGQQSNQSAPAQQNAPSQAPQQAPQMAPSQLGYYWADGKVMTPEESGYWTARNIQPWAKGTQPPA